MIGRAQHCICGIFVTLSTGIFGQGVVDTRPSFDVASVRTRVNDGVGPRTTTMDDEPGGLQYSNVSLRSCILAAYDLKDYQLEGLESQTPERYDISAKADRVVSRKELMAMLQVLLEGRFKLKFHKQLRELPVYAITAVNRKTKLREVTRAAGGSEFSGGPNPSLVVAGMSMQRLLDFLSRFTDRPVIDASEQGGDFEFKLEWSTRKNQTETEDSIFAALEQLGLKIEPLPKIARTKAPLQTMIVDHLELTPRGN
jgi:uncharacterized protein (TIGR03435 family)